MGYIAIAQNERYRGLAESNRVQTRLIPPRRGWIVDRHGRPMAINRYDVRVDLIPDFIEDKDRLIAELTRLLALRPEEVQRIRTELERDQGFQPVPVAEHLSEQQYYSLKVHEPDLPGVSVLEGYVPLLSDGRGGRPSHRLCRHPQPARVRSRKSQSAADHARNQGRQGGAREGHGAKAAWPPGRRPGRSHRAGPAGPPAHHPATGQRLAAPHDDRRRPAGICGAPARRGIGQLRRPRLQQWRHPRSGLDARLRPEQLLRRHQPFGMGDDARGRTAPADQQGAERALPARLDLQAGGGDGADWRPASTRRRQ